MWVPVALWQVRLRTALSVYFTLLYYYKRREVAWFACLCVSGTHRCGCCAIERLSIDMWCRSGECSCGLKKPCRPIRWGYTLAPPEEYDRMIRETVAMRAVTTITVATSFPMPIYPCYMRRHLDHCVGKLFHCISLSFFFFSSKVLIIYRPGFVSLFAILTHTVTYFWKFGQVLVNYSMLRLPPGAQWCHLLNNRRLLCFRVCGCGSL